MIQCLANNYNLIYITNKKFQERIFSGFLFQSKTTVKMVSNIFSKNMTLYAFKIEKIMLKE